MGLMTDQQKAEYNTKLTAFRPSVFTPPKGYKAPKAETPPKTGGKVKAVFKFENGLEIFENAPIGERNHIAKYLSPLGRSLEITGHFLHSETRELILQAAYHNGWVRDEGIDYVTDVINRGRSIADAEHDDDLVHGSSNGSKSKGVGNNTVHSIVSPLLYQLPLLYQDSMIHEVTYIASQIYHSKLSSNYKSVGYYLLAWFAKHRYQAAKYSARVAAASSGISKDTANRAINAITRDPSINISILDSGHGTDETGKIGKTKAIVLDLKSIPSTSMDNPPVDLRIYAERTQRSDDYIADTQAANRDKRRNYVKENNISTVVEPVVTKPKPRQTEDDPFIAQMMAVLADDDENHAEVIKSNKKTSVRPITPTQHLHKPQIRSLTPDELSTSQPVPVETLTEEEQRQKTFQKLLAKL